MVSIGKWTYKKILFIMQTAIQILQKVDLFLICQQSAIKKSSEIYFILANRTQAYQGAKNFQKSNIFNDFNWRDKVIIRMINLK